MAESILVLGGSGFVGRYLAEYLAPTRTVKTTSRTGKNADYSFDVLGNDATMPGDFDVVINCMVSYDDKMADSLAMNVLGTARLLERMAQTKCYYVNLSSILATSENRLINTYSFSKHLSDKVADFYRLNSKLRCATLRYGQLYDTIGLAEKSQRGLYHIARAIRRSEPVKVFDEKGTRSYMPIELVCRTVGVAIERRLVGEYNVVMKDRYTLSDLAAAFAAINGYDKSKITKEQRNGVAYTIPDCSAEFVDILKEESNLPYFKNLLLHPGAI